MSEDGPMNKYLKDYNIVKAAQIATSVLSVVNHAAIKKIKLKDKIKVRIAFYRRSPDITGLTIQFFDSFYCTCSFRRDVLS